ncbi:MAG TPA: M23 family metallopeptidase [Anaeromyxobacteraceae bacterium]
MRRILTSLLLATAACATTPVAKLTFDEIGLAAETAPAAPTSAAPIVDDAATIEALLSIDPDEPPRPPVADPAPERVASEAAPGPAVDATLLRFAADARERRASDPPSQAFPERAVSAWEALAGELERYLARAMPQTPLAELVRARITVEAELGFDRRRFGAPPPALAARLADRVQRLARRAEAARALGQTLFAATRPPALRWPISDAGLTSVFGVRLHPIDRIRRMHWGIDLAAAAGRVVSSAARGFVVHAGFTPGYGLAVEVRHDGELTSRYGHLSRLLCAPGDRVDSGQPLGLVGATGRATGPHLHFEVWRGGRAEDPLVLLGSRWTGSGGN